MSVHSNELTLSIKLERVGQVFGNHHGYDIIFSFTVSLGLSFFVCFFLLPIIIIHLIGVLALAGERMMSSLSMAAIYYPPYGVGSL